ncbi:MAG: hypothetical protein KAY37_00185 [Phycisphaerae bacterium]|nr:hypothetical protein [Phycisphaerae bacterium]
MCDELEQPGPNTPASPRDAERRPFSRHAVLYPQTYLWYVFLSSLDLMFTRIILHLDGREINTLANWIIETYNIPGLIAYKFILVVFVVLVCEIVGRRNVRLGRKLGRWAIALSVVPVVVGAFHLLRVSLALHAD